MSDPSREMFFCEEPPEFEYQGGLFHITYDIGPRRVERVMRPAVFFQSVARAVEVSREHRMGNVVPIEAVERDHAASASGSPSK
jgi:hypothetical protein